MLHLEVPSSRSCKGGAGAVRPPPHDRGRPSTHPCGARHAGAVHQRTCSRARAVSAQIPLVGALPRWALHHRRGRRLHPRLQGVRGSTAHTPRRQCRTSAWVPQRTHRLRVLRHVRRDLASHVLPDGRQPGVELLPADLRVLCKGACAATTSGAGAVARPRAPCSLTPFLSKCAMKAHTSSAPAGRPSAAEMTSATSEREMHELPSRSARSKASRQRSSGQSRT